MTRLAFFLLAATLVFASLVWWWQPAQPSGTPDAATPVQGAVSEAVETAAAAVRSERAAPPAAVSPSPAGRADAPPSSSADVAAEPELPAPTAPGAVGEPRLAEAPLEEIAPPAAFDGEVDGEADAASLASLPDAPASGAPERAEARPERVDVERSGDLVRRMLTLYEAMRE